MKTEYRIFVGVSLFLIVTAAVYGWWTNHTLGGVEWIGVVALIMSTLLCAMCGGYFWFVSRRIDLRPEDRLDAEIADGAGELGFFSPGSYWPFGIAVSALIASLGLVFWMWWLIALGIICVLLSASALLFEYYTGTRRTAEH
ncbi:cytochrome c oxidase polypeptide 4 [Catellatospora sp. TT07R-123]|uniref:cytochrome c oxidase subunit 4 n=1 Tax=Catellatospora sp. TT07R-123 TaxID=2733863 RepID=UPI001B19EB22|nr:cytochrome c oxidase subunit 4 [Catellatospora sp. TT07R-123]GHJ45050.1 cytochrome c oxidase polypeptide 4 [Catellatospora sp. TT07R-123]